MSRKITLGDNSQYIEFANSVTQTNYIIRKNPILPNELSDTQWNEFLVFIENFLESKESNELSESTYKQIDAVFTKANQEKNGVGWNRFRTLLSDSANVTTLITPIISFIAGNSNQIAQWIKDIFQQ